VRKQNLIELTSEVKKITKDLPIIVGSQAIFAITDFPPEIVRKSVECDYLLQTNLAKLRSALTEKLGIFSNYQQEKGFFADILGLATVVLPKDWEKRLVELKTEDGQLLAFCVEIHDVAVSKLMAGREKDFEFLQIAFKSDYLEISTFIERTELIEKLENEKDLREVTNEIRELKRKIEKNK
jgi:hypothetical protein